MQLMVTIDNSCRLLKDVGQDDILADIDFGVQVEDDLKQGGAKSQEIRVTSVDKPTAWNLRIIDIINGTVFSSIRRMPSRR